MKFFVLFFRLLLIFPNHQFRGLAILQQVLMRATRVLPTWSCRTPRDWVRAIRASSRALGWSRRLLVIVPGSFGGLRNLTNYKACGSWRAKHFFSAPIWQGKVWLKFCTKVSILFGYGSSINDVTNISTYVDPFPSSYGTKSWNPQPHKVGTSFMVDPLLGSSTHGIRFLAVRYFVTKNEGKKIDMTSYM